MATHKTLEAPCCSGEILHTRLTEIKCSRWSKRSECSDKIKSNKLNMEGVGETQREGGRAGAGGRQETAAHYKNCRQIAHKASRRRAG